MFFRSVYAALNETVFLRDILLNIKLMFCIVLYCTVLYCIVRIVLYCSYCIVLFVLYINVMYMWRTPRLVLNALFGQST